MYIPKHNEETDVSTLHALIQARPLGTLVAYANGQLHINHIPFLLDRNGGEYGTLHAHVARGNEIWKLFSEAAACAVVFQGSDAYISPSWYPSKQVAGKAVPTWNYAVVHAHGQPRIVEDASWLLEHVSHLTAAHETGRAHPWHVSDAPPEYVERLVGAIVGIEIPIAKLVGKWKVSQNRTEEDKLGVIEGLLGSGDDRSQEMAQLVRVHGIENGR